MEISKDQKAMYHGIMEEKLREYDAMRPKNLAAGAVKWEIGANAIFTGFAAFLLDVNSFSGVNQPPVPKDKTFHYRGYGGGVLAGGGTTYGTFWSYIDRPQLPGASGFSLQAISAATTIQFYRDGIGLIGLYVGGGLNFGGGLGGGTGSFDLPT